MLIINNITPTINAITPKIVSLPYIELIQRDEVKKIAIGPSAPPIIPIDGVVVGIKRTDIKGVTILMIISNAPIIIDIIESFFINQSSFRFDFTYLPIK